MAVSTAAFSHAVSANATERFVDFCGARNVRGREQRGYVFSHNQPRRINRFVIEERVFGRCAFAVAESARLIEGANDHDAPPRRATETGLERILQRQFYFSKLNSFKVEFHITFPNVVARGLQTLCLDALVSFKMKLFFVRAEKITALGALSVSLEAARDFTV